VNTDLHREPRDADGRYQKRGNIIIYVYISMVVYRPAERVADGSVDTL